MGISFRRYLFPEDGSLRRIPRRLADALALGRDTISEYAGTTQRVAYVVVELDSAKPVRILDARGRYWSFDDRGRVDKDLQRQAVDEEITCPKRVPANPSFGWIALCETPSSGIGSPHMERLRQP